MKPARRLLPLEPLDLQPGFFDTHDVERVLLAAAARRRGSPRLNDQGRVTFDLIARGGVNGVTGVKVSCQKDIHTAGRQCFHRHARAPHQVALVVAGRQVKRMMRDDDFQAPTRRAELLPEKFPPKK